MIENIPLSKLKLLERNPRTISKDQMQKLCDSIKSDPDFLKCRPVLVNSKSILAGRELIVYAGNQRVRAAKKLKMKEIPCIIECDLDDDVMKKRTILDNKTFGEFDFDQLANEYDIEMLLDCGFNAEEILGDLSDTVGENIVEEEKKKVKQCPHCNGLL